MAEGFTILIDGKKAEARPGETILDVLRREQVETPTLCNHQHLTPAKTCRACVVELKGSRPLVASCERKAEPDMEVRTDSERVQNARRGVFELLLSQNDVSTAPGLVSQAEQLGAVPDRYRGQKYERGFFDDNKLYVRDFDKCILCYRCVEACGPDVQNTFALTVAGRGFTAGISAGFDETLVDSACVFCGNCVEVCPTGALMDRREHTLRAQGRYDESQQDVVQTTCSYCGVGCQLDLHVDRRRNEIVKVTSPDQHPITLGFLCVKGRYGYSFLEAEDKPEEAVKGA